MLREKELNKRAREEAIADEKRRAEELTEAEAEKEAELHRREQEKKARQARRAAKMKKRQEELNKKADERVLAQYCLTKAGKKLGKLMRLGLDDLRVFKMTSKRVETLELKKGHMVPTGVYELDDPQFNAKPCPGTTDQLSLTVTQGKRGKAKTKVYYCEDRPALMQDLAKAIFKANLMEPRRFQVRKYTRNDRYASTWLRNQPACPFCSSPLLKCTRLPAAQMLSAPVAVPQVL